MFHEATGFSTDQMLQAFPWYISPPWRKIDLCRPWFLSLGQGPIRKSWKWLSNSEKLRHISKITGRLYVRFFSGINLSWRMTLTSIICECRIVATELMMESMHGLHIVVLIYSEPIELDRRSSRCSWLVSGDCRLGWLSLCIPLRCAIFWLAAWRSIYCYSASLTTWLPDEAKPPGPSPGC